MIEINLHPSADGKKRRRRGAGISLPDLSSLGSLDRLREDPWQAVMVVVLAVVPLLVLGLWWTQSSRTDDLESRLEAARADSVRLADLRAATDSLRARRTEIRERIRLVQQLDGDRFVWPHMLDELSAALPAAAWLTAVKRTSPMPSLEVQLLGMAATPTRVTEYMRALESSPFIDEVQLQNTQRQLHQGQPVHGFTLLVRYRRPPERFVRTEPLVTGGL